ncbi:Tad domain-containing protein [Marinicauda algicola]|nr:Tad domain-containing protein [Marinicauda algicola]
MNDTALPRTAATRPCGPVRRRLLRFLLERAGNVSVAFALALVPLVSAVGGAVDFAAMHDLKTRMQSAVDGAALDAAIRFGVNDPIDAGSVQRFFAANLQGQTVPSAGIERQDGLYTVSASFEHRTHFLGLIGIETLSATVVAQARPVPGEPVCLLALEPSDVGVYVNSDSRIDANCALHINSSSSKAAEINSRAHVATAANHVVGGVYTNSSSSLTPAATEDEVFPDPFAGRPLPSGVTTAGCDYIDYEVNSGSATLRPGRYCGLKVNSGATVTLNPGIYVIRGSTGLDINANSHVSGTGVSLYFADDAPLKVNSGASLSIQAPRTGETAGVAIFQTPSAAGAGILVNSHSTGTIEGLIYAPESLVTFNSDSSSSAPVHAMALIVGQLYVNSDSRLRIEIDPEEPNLPGVMTSGAMAARLVR